MTATQATVAVGAEGGDTDEVKVTITDPGEEMIIHLSCLVSSAFFGMLKILHFYNTLLLKVHHPPLRLLQIISFLQPQFIKAWKSQQSVQLRRLLLHFLFLLNQIFSDLLLFSIKIVSLESGNPSHTDLYICFCGTVRLLCMNVGELSMPPCLWFC